MEFKHQNRNQAPLTAQNILSWQSLVNWSEHLLTAVISLVINIPVMNEVWRERRELEKMTSDQISDIGLDPIRVAIECQRSFFDIPAERKKAVFVMTFDEFSQVPTPNTNSTLKA